ncbi:MAG: sigma-70 family RNA polymerase sigma factor [Steroidobacteraceae bacterium]
MQRYQDGHDHAAFAALFARNKDPLFRFLVRLSGDEQVAEDVSQHTWMRIIELARAGAYDARSPASFQTFLCTVARNRYVDEYQRRHAVTRTDPLDEELHEGPHDPQDDPLESLLTQQSRQHVRHALQSLRFEQREVLALWMHGIELKEVARMTGATWDTIVARKKHALKRLAAVLRAGALVGTT